MNTAVFRFFFYFSA
ncbi:pheST operon leader peptide PheM [Nissabacter sp. SGAir0207]|nr:pheST operon leader peptide PheM [Nissabacter sp. SGAir0207]